MAQQVTANNQNLLDSLTTNSKYADTAKKTANSFEKIYNKSIDNIKTQDKNSVQVHSTVSVKKAVENEQSFNNIDKIQSDSSPSELSETDVNIVEDNSVVADVESLDVESDDTENVTAIENNSDIEVNSEELSSNEECSNNTEGVILDLFDVESTKIDTEDISVEIDSQIIEELPLVEEVVIDAIDSDIPQANIVNNSLVSSNVQQVVTTQADDAVSVEANENIVLDVDVEDLSKATNKDLISQELVDELNVSIEEVIVESSMESSSSDVLMNTSDQAAKYNMEKLLEAESVQTEDTVQVEDTAQVEEIIQMEEFLDVPDEQLVKEKDLSGKAIDDTSLENDDTQLNDVENTSSQDNLSQDDLSQDELKRTMNEDADIYSDSQEVDVEPDFVATEPKSNTIAVDVSSSKNDNSSINNINSTNSTSKPNQSQYLPKENILTQIHNKLQGMNATTNSKLTMVLNPESLGKVQIQLMNTVDGVKAEMLVSSQAVKDLLDESISNLKETLSAQGVQVNDVSVKVEQSQNSPDMDYTEQENSQSNKQKHNSKENNDDNEKEFEQMFSNELNSDEQEENN